MKRIKVTLEFDANDNVTEEFIRDYFEKMMVEKVHNPVLIEIEEAKIDDKL